MLFLLTTPSCQFGVDCDEPTVKTATLAAPLSWKSQQYFTTVENKKSSFTVESYFYKIPNLQLF